MTAAVDRSDASDADFQQALARIEAAGWRHFRYTEPHEAVPVPGTEYDDPSGKIGARCANCGDGEAIGRPRPLAVVTAAQEGGGR